MLINAFTSETLLHFSYLRILIIFELASALPPDLVINLIILILLVQNSDLTPIFAPNLLIRSSIRLRFKRCSYINLLIPGSFISPLQSEYSPLTLILLRNSIITFGKRFLSIIIITYINQATKFITPYRIVVILSNPIGIIKAIISLLLTLSISWLYPEKKLISNIYIYPANSLENSLINGGIFISLKVTAFIFIIILISQYIPISFLATRNYRFLYRPFDFTNTPRLRHIISIYTIIGSKAFG